MKRIVIGVLIFVLVMTSCTVNERGQELESNEQAIVVPTPTKVVLASEDETEPLEVEEETTSEQLVDIEIIRKKYYPFWEFLEKGNKEDYFQPDDGLIVEFKFDLEGYGYRCGVDLKSPSYRVFKDVFPELKTSKDEGFQARISYEEEVSDCKHISIISIIDRAGNKVWDYKDEKDPRPLSLLEEWPLMWAKKTGDDALIASLYDYQPKCDITAGFLNECIRPFSPPEEFARIVAFNTKVTDPAQNVWVLNNFGCQSNYRWIDYKTGEVLQKRDEMANLWELPSSGELALQINNGIWETTYAVDMVGPGWVVSVNEEGELFEAAPIGFSQLGDFEKIFRTIEWSLEEMMYYLLLFSNDGWKMPDQELNA